MIPKIYWIAMQGIGSICSIIGFSALFYSNVSQAIQISVAVLIIIGISLFLIGEKRRKSNSMIRVDRQVLINTGIELVKNVKKQVVMFGSDMSWATDYEDIIRAATNKGKTFIVLYEESKAEGVLRNADILSKAGATLISISHDSRIRGMLIDPQEHDDALLYVAYRKAKTKSLLPKEGDKSTSANFEYHAKIYNMESDPLIIRAITGYYEKMISK